MLFDDETPIGMTSVSIDRNDPTGKTALLWGSWLAPEYRGKGLSDLMYQSRINWAKDQPTVERIIVSHRASNLASKYANQKHGFVEIHKKEKIWTDGATEDEIFYELEIKKIIRRQSFAEISAPQINMERERFELSKPM